MSTYLSQKYYSFKSQVLQIRIKRILKYDPIQNYDIIYFIYIENASGDKEFKYNFILFCFFFIVFWITYSKQ